MVKLRLASSRLWLKISEENVINFCFSRGRKPSVKMICISGFSSIDYGLDPWKQICHLRGWKSWNMYCFRAHIIHCATPSLWGGKYNWSMSSIFEYNGKAFASILNMYKPFYLSSTTYDSHGHLQVGARGVASALSPPDFSLLTCKSPWIVQVYIDFNINTRVPGIVSQAPAF